MFNIKSAIIVILLSLSCLISALVVVGCHENRSKDTIRVGTIAGPESTWGDA